MADPVLVEKLQDDAIWVVTLNRPDALNTVGEGMGPALTQAFEEFRDEPAARVAILTGAGDRAFCAGLDLNEMARNREASVGGETGNIDQGDFSPLAERLGVWKPVIGAVNGYAIAAGMRMLLQCDIRVAAEHASFAITEARFNLAGAGWMASLLREVSLSNALELTLWGDTFWSAQRAYDAGFVQRVVPQEQLMPTAMEYAERMLSLAPRTVRNIKEVLHRTASMSPFEQEAFGRAVEQNLAGMADTAEGAAAFAEKRKPIFRDR